MGKELYSTTQFIEAIKGSGGIVTTIAHRVGCTWHTAKKYIDTHPTVAKAYLDEQESILDMAEGVVFKNIRDGDTQDAKWYLSKKGKHRGYGEAIQHEGEVKLNVVYDNERE